MKEDKKYLYEAGEPSDKCPICTINCYGTKETKYGGHIIKGEPIVWPCGITGPKIPINKKVKKDERFQCPFETSKEQESIPDIPFLKD